MDKRKKTKCPGCSRHCAMGAEKCRYGRRYFAKAAQETGRKWEKYVIGGGDAWHLIDASQKVKKALKKGADETELFSALDAQELSQLRGLLSKLGSVSGENTGAGANADF